MNFRQSLSGMINRLLRSLGYALVRTDGSRNTTLFSEHQGKAYAYEAVLIGDNYAPWATDQTFLDVYGMVQNHTLVDIFRCHELHDLVRTVATIPGDIIEIGVWRGGTAAILCSAARRWKPASTVWLCDTFSGVVKAGALDSGYIGGEHADTGVTLVEDLLGRTGVTNWKILKGIFPEDTSHAITFEKIALCHIDVDVYQSATDIVSWVLPRMSSGGIIVFDDYGFSSCKGITRLVNELRDDGNWLFVHNINKHALLIRR